MLTLQPRTVLTLSFLATMSAISLPLAKAQTTVSSLTPPSSTESSKTSASPNGDLRLEVERLEMLVHEQQKRIDALEAEHHPANVEALESSSTATPFASAAVPDAHMTAPTVVVSSSPTGSSTPQGGPAPQTVQAGSTDERVRNLERQIKGIGANLVQRRHAASC